MSTSATRRAWLEIDQDTLRANLRALREPLAPSVQVIPMVKANGYGLGMLPVVRALESEGVWGWGVATVQEGISLRDAGVRSPIVVFTPVVQQDYADAVGQDLSLSISDGTALSWLVEAAHAVGWSARFHLEVDTGMGRAGIDWRHAGDLAEPIAKAVEAGTLRWEGMYTHFHSADEAGGPGMAEQAERLNGARTALAAAGDPSLVHACNSAAVFRLTAPGMADMALDAVRPGIFLYGGGIGPDLPSPGPVASLRARVTRIRSAEPGDTLGYGSTYRARGVEKWATVGIGYGDGLPRSLSNRGQALVRGHLVPIIGRISMDVTVVDISNVDGVGVGETVTFFGTDGSGSLDLDEVASTAETFSYELLTGISARVQRVWTNQ
jgi:alanine racemase